MKPIARAFFALFISSCMLSCSSGNEVKFKHHTRRSVEALVSNARHTNSNTIALDFRALFPSDWDSLILLNPYTESKHLSDLDISNMSSVDDRLDKDSYNDAQSTVLLVENRAITEYHTLPRVPVNFSGIVNQAYFATMPKDKCKSVLFRHNSPNSYQYIHE